MGPVEGALDPAQLSWFERFVAEAKRPFLVGSHHFRDLRIDGEPPIVRAAKSRHFAGWIYGHEHVWCPDLSVSSWAKNLISPTLSLPSTGLWGDIGYVLFRTSPEGATAELVQSDFYFQTPVAPGARPRAWDVRLAENRGKTVKFAFDAVRQGRMLAIGDSITAAGIWQARAGELLGVQVRSHCKGGIGAVEMVDGDGVAPPEYDPDDFGVGKLYALDVRDVADVDLVVVMGFYNEVGRIGRAETRGVATDLYPRENTFCGRVNYVIRRIRETLAQAKNDKARIVLVSPHRYGTNCWVDRSSYETGDLWISALSAVARRNGLPLVDLMACCAVGRGNWDRYQRSPTALDARYLPADGSANAGANSPFASLAEAPDPTAHAGRRITVRGVGGHYESDGKAWRKAVAPFPWFADQLHLNRDGYRLVGEAIARGVQERQPH